MSGSSLLHPHSCECTKSELDFVSLPPTQTTIEYGHWVEHHPMTSISDQGPLEFHISGSGEDYLDLGNTHLYVRAKITKSDGTPVVHESTPTTGSDPVQGDDHLVGPVNLWLHSLFNQVDMSLNETLVTPSTNTYSYRSYIETLLSYGSDAKKSWMQGEMWNLDETNKFDAPGNDALIERRKQLWNGKEVDMYGKIHSDLFYQDRLIPNGVSVKLRLVRNSDAFSLLAPARSNGDKYRVVLTEAILFVRQVKLSPTAHLGTMKILEKSTMKYPVRRVMCKVFSVSKGSLTLNHENLFLGQLPKRVVIGCVDNDAYNGQYSKNPYNFKHNKINFVSMYVDGRQVPSKPLTPDFEKDRFVRSYMSLFTSTGMFGEDVGNGLTREAYAGGSTMFGFDMTPDMSEGGHLNVIKHGNLRLEMHFADALETTINVVVYAEFDNLIEIDRTRNVTFDYAA